MPSAARRPPAGCRACRRSRAGRRRGPACRSGFGPGLVDADGRRRGDGPTGCDDARAAGSDAGVAIRADRREAAAGWTRSSSERPGRDPRARTDGPRSPRADGHGRHDPAGPRDGRSARLIGRGAFTGGPTDADLPGALADLDLAEAGRRQLRSERGQQLVGEAVDRGVVGRSTRPRSRRPVAVRRRLDRRSSSDLVAGGRLVAARAGLRASGRDRTGCGAGQRGPAARPAAPAPARPPCTAQRPEPAVARLDEVVDRDPRERIELSDDHLLQPARRLGVVGVGALARLGRRRRRRRRAPAARPRSSASRRPRSAPRPAVRHRIEAQPSGLMTE